MRSGALTVFLLAGCAAAGKLTPNYYQHGEHPYVIWYGAGHRLVGKDWRLDNYVMRSGNPEPKTKGEYSIRRQYDTDNDGELDVVQEEQAYDVLLDHFEKDAQLWVRTIPIDGRDERKDLRSFSERYVKSASGAGTVLVPFGTGVVVMVERRFATRVLAERKCTVSGKPAYRVDFEVANVDELQLSEKARWSRGSVVFVRPGFITKVGRGGMTYPYPVLMLVGASATPRDFPAIAPDFQKLLDSIAVGIPSQPVQAGTATTCYAPAASAAVPGG